MDEAPPHGGDRDPRERLDDLGRLWSPWREAYLREGSHGDGCPFCTLPGRPDREALVLARGESAFVVLNAYPYNPGHVMVVPYRHTEDFGGLTRDEVIEIALLTQTSVACLTTAIVPSGFTIGWNVGAAVGASIADHLHCHVVPRWGGDTNLMPVIGRTRVLPEMLDDTWARLAPVFAER